MSTKEIIQAIISPAEKLINSIAAAIGRIHEPTYVRKMADAKADEIEKITKVLRENLDIPILYSSKNLKIDTRNNGEITNRAIERMLFQEAIKQQNIEAVVDNAYQELQDIDYVSNTPVNPDWMFRFFNVVENITDVDMQKIWARILAGEIQTPSRYSYRTLEILRNITKEEALLFQKVAALSLSNGGHKFILQDNSLNNKHGICFSDILKLEECGIMSSQALSHNMSLSINNKDYIYNSNVLGIITASSPEMEKYSVPIHIFTEAGCQLIDAIQPKQNTTYIIDCLKYLRKIFVKTIITAHYIDAFNADGPIAYNPVNIMEDAERE